MYLVFDITKVPRNLSRQRWKDLWRWVRVVRGNLLKARMLQTERLRNHGHQMSDEQKRELIDRIVNPPIMLGPYQ